MLSYSEEIFADADGLTEQSDHCRRERNMANDLKSFLARALSTAPPGLYRDTQRLLTEADELETYFGEMEKALEEASDVVTDYSHFAASRMQDADDELSRLLRS